jgi:hypothetical protein
MMPLSNGKAMSKKSFSLQRGCVKDLNICIITDMPIETLSLAIS